MKGYRKRKRSMFKAGNTPWNKGLSMNSSTTATTDDIMDQQRTTSITADDFSVATRTTRDRLRVCNFCTLVLYFANDISVISSTGISLIFICYRVTLGHCRPISVTRRSDTGALPPMPAAEPWRIGTHRDTP